MPRPRAARASASRKPKQAPGLFDLDVQASASGEQVDGHDPALRAGDQRDRAPIDLPLKDVRHAPGVDRRPEVREIGPLPREQKAKLDPRRRCDFRRDLLVEAALEQDMLCAREEKAPDGSGHPNRGPGSSADRASPPKPFLDLLHPAVQHRRALLRRRSRGCRGPRAPHDLGQVVH